MQDTYDEYEVIDDEETVAEAAEDIEEVEEVEKVEDAEEIEEVEEDKIDLDGLYAALDKLTDYISDRFDKISALLIDAGAVIQDNVDEAYEQADLLEDSMTDRLEDLDYSI